MDDYRTQTGIAGLDEILNGGFPSGHLFVIEGEPGTGKTTLGLQYLLEGARRGERTMYVTLSESKPELEGVARSHQWSLDPVALFDFAPTEDSLRPEDQYSAFHPSEVEFQDTTQSILQTVERVAPQRLVLDSLSELRLLAHDPLRYRRQILALKHYFSNRGCTVLLLDDKTAEAHDMQLHSIAHGVVSLERLAREYGIERRRLRVAKLRGSRFREGYHDYRIDTGGIVVYPRLVAGEHQQPVPETLQLSGSAALDMLWGGGIPSGSSTLIVGPSGAGKSSLALQYAVQAARKQKFAAIFVFDEMRQTLVTRAKGLGMDLDPLLTGGYLTIEQIDPAELSPGEFVGRIRRCVTERKAAVIVIDSLNGFLNAMPGESFLALQMHELLTYLNQQGVLTILTLVQSGLLGDSMRSPVDLSYLADNILLTRYFEARGQVRKALSVVKKRSGRHEQTIRELLFANGQLEVGEPLSEFQGVLLGVPTFEGSSASLLKSSEE
jgi:circadian clock protein KaiC